MLAAVCVAGITAGAAGLTVNPSGATHFSFTNVGQQSVPQAIVAKNSGVATVTISISINEPNPIPYQARAQFAQTNNCGMSLAAGASCSVWVIHTPTHVGPVFATLSFGPANPSVSLTGDAYALDNSNIFITIDQPTALGAVSGKMTAFGWAIANHEGIARVAYSVDDPSNITADAGYGSSRADVCQAHRGVWGCPDNGYPGVGWSFNFDTTTLSNGTHTLYIKATGLFSAVGRVASAQFTVANAVGAQAFLVHVDQPISGATLTGRMVDLRGWAIGSGGVPIDRVSISVDNGPAYSTGVLDSRADVCAVYPNRPACPNVGWSYELDTTWLSDGPHTLTFVARTASPEPGSYPSVTVPVIVANLAASQSNPMRLSIDNPNSQAGSLNGTVTVNGWALADDDTIVNVGVFVDEGAASGNAFYGVSRLDVCVAYPNEPGCPNVGWSYSLDTTLLADGPHQFQVTAQTAHGKRETIQSEFTVSNAGKDNPFHVSVDYPAANGTVSGMPKISGWALSDNAPVSLVAISVDGVPDGSTVDSISRPDVCAAYPGKPKCPTVGWEYVLNTLKFVDGTHTLDITVTGGTQHATLTNSFTVANGSTPNPTLLYIDQPTASGVLSGTVKVSGWAIDDRTSLNVSMAVDAIALPAELTYGLPRQDVCNSYPGRVGCPNVGWSGLLDTTSIADGPHTLTVTAAGTTKQSASTKINVANGNVVTPSSRVFIDQPYANGPALRGETLISGWAFVASGPQPFATVYIDDLAVGSLQFFDPRVDVCAVYPQAENCPNVGWSARVDTTQFLDGAHTLKVVARSPVFGAAFVTVPIVIANFTALNPMHLAIDSSADSTLSGTATLWGWAVSDDAAITTIAVSVDGALLGNASYGDSRNDVCEVYQNRLGCPNVGWHLPIDTTGLSNGSHIISVTATDGFDAQSTQTATVTVKN